jgi:hypothetical protein
MANFIKITDGETYVTLLFGFYFMAKLPYTVDALGILASYIHSSAMNPNTAPSPCPPSLF